MLRDADQKLSAFWFVCGAVVALLGVVVLAGWYLHIPTLIQVLPHFVPMQYNTALGFLLAGLGLILIRRLPTLSVSLSKDVESYPKPNVVLLDLNLPGMDGREILEIVKNDPNLKHIPIIVLTTSVDERDIAHCYKNGVNSYIQKPVDLNKFIEAIQKLKDFWFEVVVLPKEQ